MIKQFAQHMPSNCKEDTSEYLYPTHYDFKGCIDSEIALLKDMYDYVSVSQDRIAQLRQESNNTLNYGDCIEKILKKELNNKSYSGMIDGHKVLDGFYTEDVEECDEEESGVKHNRMSQDSDKKIFTSMFDSTNKITYYFLK